MAHAFIENFYEDVFFIDQVKATEEKFKLEEEQRRGHRERKEQGVDWVPTFFERDPYHPGALNRYIYKYKK